MRIVFVTLLFVVSIYAQSYTSFHQFPDANDKVSFYQQVADNTSNRIGIYASLPYHGEAIACRDGRECYETKDPRKKNWYGTKWMRYRVYIPKNAKSFSFRFGSLANTTLVALYYFVPDGSKVKTVDFRKYKLTKLGELDFYKDFETQDARNQYFFQGYNLLYVEAYNSSGVIPFDGIAKYNKTGGWMYINMAQACTVTSCWYGDGTKGNRSDTKPYLTVSIYFDQPVKNTLDQYKYIKFDEQKDPVENFSQLQEIHRTLHGTTSITIHGITTGEYLFDPDKPSFSVDSENKQDSIVYGISLEAGDKFLEGVNPELNGNISLAVTLNECQEIVHTETNQNRAELFYSNNAQEWNSSFNEQTKYIKLELSPSDDSLVVLSPHESLNFSLQTRKKNCQEYRATVVATYEYKGEKVEETKQVTIKSQNSSSSNQTNEEIGDSGDGNNMNENSNEQQQCEANGGEWLDTFCDYSNGSPSSSSSSSSHSSSLSNEQQQCEANGGEWLDTFCDYSNGSPSSSSSSSNSAANSVSSVYERSQSIHDIVLSLAERNLSVSGYFAYYGDMANYDPFKWVYLSTSGSTFAKLDGMDPQTGYFKWTYLKGQGKDYFENISFANGEIVVGKAKENIPADVHDIVLSLAERNLSVSGYFAYYGDMANYDPFKWVYLSTSGSTFAKLDGMDPQTGYFKWTYLKGQGKDYFENISFANGEIVVGKAKDGVEFGTSSSSLSSSFSSHSSSLSNEQQQCEANGGEWMDTFCDYSNSSSNSSSASSLSSSSSSLSSSSSNYSSSSSSSTEDTALPPL